MKETAFMTDAADPHSLRHISNWRWLNHSKLYCEAAWDSLEVVKDGLPFLLRSVDRMPFTLSEKLVRIIAFLRIDDLPEHIWRILLTTRSDWRDSVTGGPTHAVWDADIFRRATPTEHTCIHALRECAAWTDRELMDRAMMLAVRLNLPPMMRALRAMGFPWNQFLRGEPTSQVVAAQLGHLECLQLLCEGGVWMSMDVIRAAAVGQHLVCFQYALAHRADHFPWSVRLTPSLADMLTPAIQVGHVAMLHAVHVSMCADERALTTWAILGAKLAEIAAQCGNVRVLEFLAQTGVEFSAKVSKCAVASGQMACVRQVHAWGVPWWNDSSISAFRDLHIGEMTAEHVDCLQFAAEHGCVAVTPEWMEYAKIVIMIQMARRGDVAGMREWHETHAYPLSANVMLEAVGTGHLACVQYLHEHGCPWHENARSLAATSGHLACLQYMHTHGCPEPQVLSVVHAVDA